MISPGRPELVTVAALIAAASRAAVMAECRAEYPLPRLTQNPYVTDEQWSLILLPEWRKFLRLGDPRRGLRTLKKQCILPCRRAIGARGAVEALRQLIGGAAVNLRMRNDRLRHEGAGDQGH